MSSGVRYHSDVLDEAQDGSTERLSQRAYQAIRTSLRRGELRPGEKLILRPLASKLRLSATPVREALLRLVSEQALGLDERSSVIVPMLGTGDLDEIHELRIDLEGRAAELTAQKGDPMVLDRLDEIRDRFAHAVDADNPLDANWEDDRFHREILLGAGRPMMVRLVDNLQVRTGPLVALADLSGKSDGRPAMQAALIGAVRAADGAAGRQAMVDGLEQLFGQLRRAATRERRIYA